jgi:Predicted permease
MSMARIDRDLYPFLIVLFLTLIALAVFWPVLDMVVLGGSIAVVLFPVHTRLSRHMRPGASAAVLTIALFAVIAATLFVTLTILRANAGVLDEIFQTIGNWLSDPATHPGAFGVPVARETLASWLAEGDALFVNYWGTITANLTLIMIKAIVFFGSFFLLLIKGQNLYDRVGRHLPEPVKGYYAQLTPVAVDTLYVIYVVQIAIAVLTFFIAIPVFYLLGYGNILFYSFLAAFCELIPILGSSVAFILIGAYALALGDMQGVLILFILGYIVVSALPEIYVRPVLVGRRVKIHPVIMFIGIIGGILTLGLVGFVLGPLIIVLLLKSYRIWTDEHKPTEPAPSA